MAENEGLGSRIGSHASLPLIGRRHESHWLDEQLSAALSGSPRVALICGDAGIGKTRLLTEFRPRMEQVACVLTGHCFEHSPPAYLPIAQILDSCLARFPDSLERLEPAEAESVRHLLGASSGAGSPAADQRPEAERLRLFMAVTHLLLECSSLRPLVVIVEDLHWMDAPSLELLMHVQGVLWDRAIADATPIAVFVTYRPVDIAPRISAGLARWQREQWCARLELTGLTEMEVSALIQGMGFPRPSHQLVGTIHSATHGNPLFVQEAMRHLEARGALERRGGWLVSNLLAREIHLPAEVMDTIQARIDALEASCRTVLALAAMLGDDASVESLGLLMECDRSDLLDALETCTREGLLTFANERFEFSHPLICHAAYASTIGPRRQHMHLAIAEMLEKRYADTIDEHIPQIAGHLVAAGPQVDAEHTMEFAREAGERSFRMFAWGDAARYYDGALAAAERWGGCPPRDIAELRFLAGLAYYRDLDIGPCLHHLEGAVAGFREAGDTKGFVRALCLQARSQMTQAAVAYGEQTDLEPLEQALAGLSADEEHLKGEMLSVMSQAYWSGRQPQKAMDAAAQSLEIGERLGDDRICTEARQSLALASIQVLDVNEALEHWRRSLEHSRRIGDAWMQGWALARIPLGLMSIGRLAEAEAGLNEAKELMRRTNDWAQYSVSAGAQACAEVARGNLGAAEGYAQEVMLAVQRSGYPWAAPVALPAVAGLRALRGEWEEADDALQLLIEPGAVFADPGGATRTSVRLYRALLAAYQGVEPDRADLERMATRMTGRRTADFGSLPAFAAVVEMAGVLHWPELAVGAVESLRRAHEKGFVFTPGWVFCVQRVLGIGEVLAGRFPDAEVYFQKAIAATGRAGARLETARACLDYARMLAQRGGPGDREEAQELLFRAREMFQDMGIQTLLEQAGVVASSLNAAPAPASGAVAEYPDRLSGREVEVLQLVARGHTNQQIADTLILSPKTVARHLSNIFDKIEADNRSAATAYVFERGLLNNRVENG